MANTSPQKRSVVPDYAVHPGESLKECLQEFRMTPKDLAQRTSLSLELINGILEGKQPITSDVASKLNEVFQTPSHYWMRFQALHDETVKRLRKHDGEE